MDWDPIWLTFKLAIVTTVLLLAIAVPLSFWLSRTNNRIKPVVETLVSMPLVLPPTVLGFYFLVALSPDNFLGNWLDKYLGIGFIFNFEGLVLASIIYSLPFMVHPIQAGFNAVPNNVWKTVKLLDKSRWQVLFKVLVPYIKPSLLTGIVLAFAHTIGEFGVILMIGGNIPEETRVASIAIYNEVESLNYAAANSYSAVLLIISFCLLLTVYMVNGKFIRDPWS